MPPNQDHLEALKEAYSKKLSSKITKIIIEKEFTKKPDNREKNIIFSKLQLLPIGKAFTLMLCGPLTGHTKHSPSFQTKQIEMATLNLPRQ